MNDEIKASEEKDVKKSWSFSKDVNNKRKSISGREVENGWIIDIHTSWTEKDNDGNDRYKSTDATYISKDNPLDKFKDKKDKEDSTEGEGTDDVFSGILNSSGMLLVD
jgi:hypothetical protein